MSNEASPAGRGPDPRAAREKYRTLVRTYRLWRAPTERLRRRTIDRLDLGPGDVVLDVGCGTGFSFPSLEERIGPGGRLIGVDQSPQMLERARQAVDANRWRNVTLVESGIEGLDLPEGLEPERVDAALFFFTHDILQSEGSIKRVRELVRPGGRIAAGGMKFADGGRLRNAFVRTVARPYVTTFDGYGEPWRPLEDVLVGLRIQRAWADVAYIAWATV